MLEPHGQWRLATGEEDAPGEPSDDGPVAKAPGWANPPRTSATTMAAARTTMTATNVRRAGRRRQRRHAGIEGCCCTDVTVRGGGIMRGQESADAGTGA